MRLPTVLKPGRIGWASGQHLALRAQESPRGLAKKLQVCLGREAWLGQRPILGAQRGGSLGREKKDGEEGTSLRSPCAHPLLVG